MRSVLAGLEWLKLYGGIAAAVFPLETGELLTVQAIPRIDLANISVSMTSQPC